MNSKDKKIYKDVVKVVKEKIKPRTIFDADDFSFTCSKYDLSVRNISVMLTQIAKNTRFIEKLGNGNYIRTERR